MNEPDGICPFLSIGKEEPEFCSSECQMWQKYYDYSRNPAREINECAIAMFALASWESEPTIINF